MKFHSNPRLNLAGKLVIGGMILMFIGLGFLLQGCGGETVPSAADGLNLHGLVAVVKQSSDGEDLEKRLNTAGGINNLDLDNDSKVDFLNVTEFGEGEFRGYSLVAELGDGQRQEVATVNIHSGPNDFTVQVKGNQQIYGGQAYVTSRIGRHEHVPFIAWAFVPRPLYVRPVVVGYRPAWYGTPVVVIPRRQYVTRTQVVTKTVVIEKRAAPIQPPAKIVNPNAATTATTIKAPLVAPTATQKQFQERPENKPVATGGFGANKTGVTNELAPPAAKRQQSDVRKEVPANPGATVKQFDIRDTNKKVDTGGFGSNKEKNATPPAAVQPRANTVGGANSTATSSSGAMRSTQTPAQRDRR